MTDTYIALESDFGRVFEEVPGFFCGGYIFGRDKLPVVRELLKVLLEASMPDQLHTESKNIFYNIYFYKYSICFFSDWLLILSRASETGSPKNPVTPYLSLCAPLKYGPILDLFY